MRWLAMGLCLCCSVAMAQTYPASPQGLRIDFGTPGPPSPPLPTGVEQTLWGSGAPVDEGHNDANPVVLGLRFRPSVNGLVLGIRFYKTSQNTGTHTGKLWTVGGQELASVTFTGETAAGWQEARFAAPVAVTAGAVYVASYHAPVGQYAAVTGYFSSAGHTSGDLYALRDGESGGNGVYVYSSAHGFPTDTYQATNYWVDLIFQPD